MTTSCLSPFPANPCLQFSLNDLPLTLWLQEPWDTRDDAVEEATVFQPILQTVKHLTWNWMTLSLIATGASSAVAWTAFSNLANLPPAPDCLHLTEWTSDRAKLLCLQAAIAAAQPHAQTTAIAWVDSWPPTHPLYNEGQELLQTWHQEANSGSGIKTVVPFFSEMERVSPTFSTSSRTEPAAVAPRWSEASAAATLSAVTQAAETYATAVVALQAQDWASAFQALWQLQDLEQTLPELSLAPKLAHQIEAERQAQSLLNRAIQKRSQANAQVQEEAIALVQQIDPATYVWQTAQPLLQTWQREYATPIPVVIWPTPTKTSKSLASRSMAETTAAPDTSTLPLPAQPHLGLLPERRYRPDFLLSESLKVLAGRSHRP